MFYKNCRSTEDLSSKYSSDQTIPRGIFIKSCHTYCVGIELIPYMTFVIWKFIGAANNPAKLVCMFRGCSSGTIYSIAGIGDRPAVCYGKHLSPKVAGVSSGHKIVSNAEHRLNAFVPILSSCVPRITFSMMNID